MVMFRLDDDCSVNNNRFLSYHWNKAFRNYFNLVGEKKEIRALGFAKNCIAKDSKSNFIY